MKTQKTQFQRTIAIADRMIESADRLNEKEEDIFNAMCIMVSSFIDLHDNRKTLWKYFMRRTEDLLRALEAGKETGMTEFLEKKLQ